MLDTSLNSIFNKSLGYYVIHTKPFLYVRLITKWKPNSCFIPLQNTKITS